MITPIILRYLILQRSIRAWELRVVSENLPSAVTLGWETGALPSAKRDSRFSMAARKIII
jgi:hypothetical protein